MQNRSRNVLMFCFSGCVILIIATTAGFIGGVVGLRVLERSGSLAQNITSNVSITNEESAVIDVAKESSPSVVSVVVTKLLPVYEDNSDSWFQQFFDSPPSSQLGTEEQQIGAGSGFIISKDGLILTNRHVVSDEDATYTVILNDGTQLDAQVLARDSILDIAVLKVTPESDLPTLPLGDSSQIKIGQSVVAIGNSLGEFSNTVSSGIISGLSRSIVASDGLSGSEQLNDVLQTDASINPGNSGGPLLDIQGNVIGVNVAVAEDAENIGFAIPINPVKKVVDSILQFGEIRRPYLGVRYRLVDAQVQEEHNLTVDYGALLIAGDADEPAVIVDSPADKIGLQAGDVILELNGQRIDADHPLQAEVLQYEVAETVVVRVLRGDKDFTVKIELGQLKD